MTERGWSQRLYLMQKISKTDHVTITITNIHAREYYVLNLEEIAL